MVEYLKLEKLDISGVNKYWKIVKVHQYTFIVFVWAWVRSLFVKFYCNKQRIWFLIALVIKVIYWQKQGNYLLFIII